MERDVCCHHCLTGSWFNLMGLFCSINAIVFKIHFPSRQMLPGDQSVCGISSSLSLSLTILHSYFVSRGSAHHPVPINPLSLTRLEKLLDPCSHVQNLNMPIPNHKTQMTNSLFLVHHHKLLSLVMAKEWASYVQSGTVLFMPYKLSNREGSALWMSHNTAKCAF